MLLVKLDSGELVLAGKLLSIQSILKEFGTHWNLWQTETKLESWLEKVSFILLEIFVSLQRSLGYFRLLGLLLWRFLLR
jgi:hypothetical protein